MADTKIDHGLNGCERQIYELQRQLKNDRTLADETIVRLVQRIDLLLAKIRVVADIETKWRTIDEYRTDVLAVLE